MGGDWKEMLLAAEKGDLDLLTYHIKMGADPNYQHPEFLTTPLIESIRFGHLDCAKYLLDNGADPTIKEAFGPHTPLALAKFLKNKEAVKLVTDYLP
ncbi:MAG: ankyrin repeat domain-containing protein [Bacteroidia bacterium]|nr:ankyrin repeat domain-containing protein [Bacteroidia bacterium]